MFHSIGPPNIVVRRLADFQAHRIKHLKLAGVAANLKTKGASSQNLQEEPH